MQKLNEVWPSSDMKCYLRVEYNVPSSKSRQLSAEIEFPRQLPGVHVTPNHSKDDTCHLFPFEIDLPESDLWVG